MARNRSRILRSGLLLFNVTPQIANAGRWLGNTGVHPSKRDSGIHRRPVEDRYSNLSVREFSGLRMPFGISVLILDFRPQTVITSSYLVIVPQAMRSPAFPEGSLIRSSALAWITSAVPPLANTELLPSPRVTAEFSTVSLAVPFGLTVKFGISPACGLGLVGLFMPWWALVGLK